MQILIVDADVKAANQLREKLGEITDNRILCFESASEALIEVEEGNAFPSICFIDVAPPGARKTAGSRNGSGKDTAVTGAAGSTSRVGTDENPAGIQTAKQLLRMLPGVQIIFTSACDDYYLTAYEVEHAYFLRKPIDSVLLRKGWERAIHRLDIWEQRHFSFRFGRTAYQIPLRDILYFEKDRRKVFLHTAGTTKPYCFYGTMDELMRQLNHNFIRCHNSYIINLTRIDTWSRSAFTIGEHKIPISRQYAKAAKAAFLDAHKG